MDSDLEACFGCPPETLGFVALLDPTVELSDSVYNIRFFTALLLLISCLGEYNSY
jgi:hypothetical protein